MGDGLHSTGNPEQHLHVPHASSLLARTIATWTESAQTSASWQRLFTLGSRTCGVLADRCRARVEAAQQKTSAADVQFYSSNMPMLTCSSLRGPLVCVDAVGPWSLNMLGHLRHVMRI